MRVVPHLVIVAGVAALVVAAGVPLLVELRAARARRRATTCELDADERLPWAVRAVGMLREAVSQWLVLLAAPLTLGRRYARIVVNRADTPLVAVLGWGQHPVLWRTLLRRLRADGWGPIAVVGWTTPRLSLDVGVEALAAAVARLRAATGAARVDVVAHGAGGLVVRAYVRTHPADAGIRRVVTVGTPHQGTVVARWAGLGRSGRR